MPVIRDYDFHRPTRCGCDLIERDALLAFLAAAHPFGQLAAPEAPAMRSVPLGEVPLLQPGVRPSW